tara:strand:+ start:22 stop:828 length:807 start_codon:yes stop_codon:yes gene_type:complete
MIPEIRKLIFRNRFSLYFRNSLNLRPVDTYYPKDIKASVSDFFFWKSNLNFDTKFMLTNVSSHIIPKKPQNDEVQILIFNKDGKILKEIKYDLMPFESKEIIFSQEKVNGYGSFFVFHNFKYLDSLLEQGSHVAERGYVGYKKGNNIWNFMHGNYNACYLTNKKKIESIISRSFFYQTYSPQIIFNDTKKFEIIINNPTKFKNKFTIFNFDNENNLINKKTVFLDPFNTEIFQYKDIITHYIKINSKILFCRPIIYKEYETYFDIFHG